MLIYLAPAIINIILYEFDEQIGRWCRERNIAYTRYCDDMTFSGDFGPAKVMRFVSLELKKLGIPAEDRSGDPRGY